MNSDRAQQIAVTAMGVTFASVALNDLSPKHLGGKGISPTWEQIIGGLATATLLTIIAEPAPQIAVALALSIAGTAFVTQALPIVFKYTGTNKTTDQKADD